MVAPAWVEAAPISATTEHLSSAGNPPTLGTPVLRTNRRPDRGHLHHVTARARVLFDLRLRSEDREVGGSPNAA